MKKLLYSAMILLLASATSCKQNDDKCKICNETNCQITHVKCDACGEWDCEENHWATTLGIASFASDTIWTISNGTITQTWSDVVQTDSCSGKTAFDGGNYTTSFYNVDCRSNPGQKGDLFSWRAVKEVVGICPQGWRVPDTADFRNLDIALGFNGQNRYQETINGH
ncbi:MAG: fibrobacter succinogenes major paralogous domain-containing protein, partial [Bacteroidales bacterium]|nr:fibrobacter succinogenes major paralogous domain-containing protein [Bacteroidales bacterium]